MTPTVSKTLVVLVLLLSGWIPVANGEASGAPDDDGAEEQRRMFVELYEDRLAGVGVRREVAAALAESLADPERAEATASVVRRIFDAAADLQLAAVDSEKSRKVVEAITAHGDADPAEVSEKVGEAATEEVFGPQVAALVPAAKRPQFRDVFRNLIDMQAALMMLGAEADDPEVVAAIREAASKGVTDQRASRPILERAAQSVLDRSGFPAAKPGETVAARMDRIAAAQMGAMPPPPARPAAKVGRPAVGAGGQAPSPAVGRADQQPVAGAPVSPATSTQRFHVTGGDGGGLAAGRQSSMGIEVRAPSAGSGGGANIGAGAGMGGPNVAGGSLEGASGAGGRASGSGGGSGGGTGTGAMPGAGSGPGGGDGAGSDGRGGGGSGGSGQPQSGSGGGDGSGGSGESQSHERTDYVYDDSGEGMTVETVDAESNWGATPLPSDLQRDTGNGLTLQQRSGGRLGNAESRATLRGIEVQSRGGGTMGPTSPESVGASGVAVTAEEGRNQERALNIATGGGVIGPRDRPSVAVTDADLKDISLRGTGGAMGPRDPDPAVAPPAQDPASPVPTVAPNPRPAAVDGPPVAVPPAAQQVGDRVRSIMREGSPR